MSNNGVMEFPYSYLTATRDGPIVTLTINRPDKLNALNHRVLMELTAAIDTFTVERGDHAPRVVILTGAGDRAFAAGADIAELATLTSTEAEALSRVGHHLGERMQEAPFPIIAAVNGFALGGGCELVLACDLAYASPRAKFGQPEVNLGVIPGFGGTQRLVRRVGIAKARELLYTGATIDAAEAERIGLLNGVFADDQLHPGVLALARTIAAKGPLAIAAAKRVLGAGADLSSRDANELEARSFGALFATADQREGMAAFLGKRPPVFQGR